MVQANQNFGMFSAEKWDKSSPMSQHKRQIFEERTVKTVKIFGSTIADLLKLEEMPISGKSNWIHTIADYASSAPPQKGIWDEIPPPPIVSPATGGHRDNSLWLQPTNLLGGGGKSKVFEGIFRGRASAKEH